MTATNPFAVLPRLRCEDDITREGAEAHYEASDDFGAEAWDAFCAASPASHEEMVVAWYRSSSMYATAVDDVMDGER